jgi:hypothetical protein
MDKQSVGNLALDSGYIHDVVTIVDGPALDAGTTSEFSHGNSQEVAATFAFFQNLGSKVLCAEASSPEGLAPQPELHHLFTIPANRRVSTYPKQRCMHVWSTVIEGKSAGGEQAVVKQSGARPVAANHKHR